MKKGRESMASRPEACRAGKSVQLEFTSVSGLGKSIRLKQRSSTGNGLLLRV